MAEFIALFFLTFFIPAVFYVFQLPFEYLDEIMIGVVVIIGVHFFLPLFTAPFVPSQKKRVETMIKLADLKKTDRVKELGCGDARIIRAAARAGVEEAIGYEISVLLVYWARFVGLLQKNSAKIFCKNLWSQDYSKTTVVFCYLLPHVMPRLEKEIWSQLPKGARLVSHAFAMKNIKEDKKENSVYLYIKK